MQQPQVNNQMQSNFIARQIICSNEQCQTKLAYNLGVYCVKCPICNTVTAAQNLNITGCNKCNNKL
jgi:LSD1 subclass zinc finger protein